MMSQDYYIVCDKCSESIQVGQTAGLANRVVTFYSGEKNCMTALQRFLDKHCFCGPRFLWENADTQDGKYKEWEWQYNLPEQER